ncbi:MAG: alpha/beta hydrolase [Gammaproteobacteria bacterium]|nr:alpha/beta hydrolase [Gammaproteobacteria bacterium]
MPQKTIVAGESGRLGKVRFNSSERRQRVIPFKYQMFGLALNIISRLNNEWAAGILSRLWFTVFKTKQKTWLTEFWQQADSCIDIQLKDKSIPVSLWGQGPLVVMMHGWSGSGAQFRRFIPGLVKAGFQVATFDAPSHGSNPGKQTHLLEFTDSLLAIQQQIGEVHTLMAHSLGGMAAVMATRRGLVVKQVVMFGPHLDVQIMYQSYSDLLNLKPELTGRFREKIGQRMNEILGEHDIWAMLTPARLLAHSDYRGMLIYDLEDEEIPQSQFKAVAQHWTDCLIFETRGLGHNRILKDDSVIGAVLAFMKPV